MHVTNPKCYNKTDLERWTEINPSNLTIVAFTERSNLERLGPLKLRTGEKQLSREVKYLRILSDYKLTCSYHLDNKRRRSSQETLLDLSSLHIVIMGERQERAISG